MLIHINKKTWEVAEIEAGRGLGKFKRKKAKVCVGIFFSCHWRVPV